MTAYAVFSALALFVMTSNAAPSSRPNFVIMYVPYLCETLAPRLHSLDSLHPFVAHCALELHHHHLYNPLAPPRRLPNHTTTSPVPTHSTATPPPTLPCTSTGSPTIWAGATGRAPAAWRALRTSTRGRDRTMPCGFNGRTRATRSVLRREPASRRAVPPHAHASTPWSSTSYATPAPGAAREASSLWVTRRALLRARLPAARAVKRARRMTRARRAISRLPI